MEEQKLKLSNKIFWKIYVIWFFRRILPIMVFQVAVFALVIKIFAKNVFISKVLQNSAVAADSGYWIFLKYLVNSFLNTRPMVQVAILIGLGIMALILRDIMRSFWTYKSMWFKRG